MTILAITHNESFKTLCKREVFNLLFTKTLKAIVLTIAISSIMLFSTDANAQNSEVDNVYKPFSINAHLKNMHIWHGFVVHPSALFATSLEYNTRNKKFTFGFWGGASFSGVDVEHKETGELVSASYKEFSIYTKYQFNNRFFIEAVTHNNYTGVEERGDKLSYWSYDKTQGYNFVDVNLGYYVTPKTLLYLATIIGGGSGDYEIQNDGSLKDSWTHYFEVKHKIWENDTSHFSAFVGGAWSFITDKTFYTESAGNVINVGVAYNKSISISNHNIPVEVTAMWNPEQEKTVLQLDIQLF